MIVGMIQGVAAITEKEWQEARARRASFRQTGRAKFANLHNFVRLTLGGGDLKAQRTTVILMVRMVQAVFSLPLLVFAMKLLGITDMGTFLHSLKALFHLV